MSFFSWLSSSPKVIDDVFDKDKGLLAKTGEWIGNSNFTDEERAELNTANMESIRRFVADTLEESTDRSRARREIAVFFIKFYSIMLFMAGMTYPFNSGWSEVWFNIATSGSVGGLVIAISIFFFGSHGMVRYNNSKKGN